MKLLFWWIEILTADSLGSGLKHPGQIVEIILFRSVLIIIVFIKIYGDLMDEGMIFYLKIFGIK